MCRQWDTYLYTSIITIKIRLLIVTHPSIGIVFTDDKDPSTLCACAKFGFSGVSGAWTRNSKPSIGIVFVGDKDPNIQHQNHVHQCYYKSEPFHDRF